MRSAPHRSNKILILSKFNEFRLREIFGGKGITLPLVHPIMFPFFWTLPPCLSGFGGKGIRTPDFQLAKLALYQLSYAPAFRIAECRLSIADFKKLFSWFPD